MSKAVLISIKPKWVELIATGRKKIEIRKTIPKLEVPFRCFIYETSDGKYENIGVHDQSALLYKDFLHHPQRVIGEFVCDRIEMPLIYGGNGPIYNQTIVEASCLTRKEILEYSKGKNVYSWHISKLVIYDKPKELIDFQRACNHKEDCCTCKRWNAKDYACISGISRPPQSYMFVEEL